MICPTCCPPKCLEQVQGEPRVRLFSFDTLNEQIEAGRKIIWLSRQNREVRLDYDHVVKMCTGKLPITSLKFNSPAPKIRFSGGSTLLFSSLGSKQFRGRFCDVVILPRKSWHFLQAKELPWVEFALINSLNPQVLLTPS